MSVLDAKLVAIEGAHGTGKTTFAHALTSAYLRRNHQVVALTDVARRSPFVEQVVIYRAGTFGVSAQLQLLAAQLEQEQLAARHNDLVVLDRSVLSTIAYTRLLTGNAGADADLIEAMSRLAHTYARRYDAVVLLSDLHELDDTRDPYRLGDTAMRLEAQRLIAAELRSAGVVAHEMPAGLETSEQIAWAMKALARYV